MHLLVWSPAGRVSLSSYRRPAGRTAPEGRRRLHSPPGPESRSASHGAHRGHQGDVRGEKFLARIGAAAKKRLGAGRPILKKEIGKDEAQAAKTQAAMDCYVEAFEAGTLTPDLCNEKVRDLCASLEELMAERLKIMRPDEVYLKQILNESKLTAEVEMAIVEVRRKPLEHRGVGREVRIALVENVERVLAEGPAPQKKHLLHRLLQKVLVQNRRTVEVWYGLPNPQRFEDWNKWLLGRDSNPRPTG